MISADGYRFKDEVVQSFIISPGERYDFIVNATESSGCYWIRAETLEQGRNHSVEAILQYTDNKLVNTDYEDYQTNVRSGYRLSSSISNNKIYAEYTYCLVFMPNSLRHIF